ncbi:MAG: 30S ribosomal protein S6 [Candidatus Omnitrophica bacterium]|nr:30S ribosomal protein S6 [Candidatus Omnitrophota bacterium]MBI5023817.1 30S ribosomal protein S6 [Candidatus Omnitrophota bacterium]
MKTETLRKYELMIIVDAKLANEEKETVRREATEIVTKAGGKIINSQIWLEKQKFSFAIKKCAEGTYYLINFEGEGAVIGPIRSDLRLNERILRFAVTKVD